jgi:argininosuccinate lyase
MPQKRNPDVMELVRAKARVVHAALFEVMGLSSSLGSGYHRDFQLLKSPLIRGVAAARSMLRMVSYVLPGIEVVSDKAAADCDPPIYATHRALELVVSGTPFRNAYQQVANELTMGTLPASQDRPAPGIDAALEQIGERRGKEVALGAQIRGRIDEAYRHLLTGEVAP